MAITELRLTAAHQDVMLAHVQQHWPEEACGLLGGPPGEVARVYCVENIRHSRVEYYMDPVAQVEAMLAIEAAGWEICGIFHSHPAGPAEPSATDVAQAFYPEAVYIILAPTSPNHWAMRGFAIEAEHVREVALVLVE